MKIANVMLGRGLGGIEQALIDYSEALQLAGFEVCNIIHPKATIKSILQKKNMKFEVLDNFSAFDLFAACKLYKLLKAIGVDVSIAHGNRALSLLKYATSKDKIIAVTHNYKIKCKGLKTVFCPTQDLVHQTKIKKVPNIFLIPNMVRVNREFTQRKIHNPPVIGAMGRFVAKKGFDVFIEALAILKAENINFRAVLAGNGEEDNFLRALAKDNGLDGVLEFTGWVENQQEFFDKIDIFCLPSHHEPFGIVLLEAMAQSLPVISSDSEGPSEIIQNGINGMLVPKGNEIALANAIKELLADKIEDNLFSVNAYDSVKNNYDLAVVSGKLRNALVLCA